MMNPCDGRFASYQTPWGITVTVHVELRDRFRAACEDAAKNSDWVPKRIDSYNCRRIRGSTSWSRHAYAAAFDFFSSGPGIPPPGGVWGPTSAPSEKFCHSFRKWGFTCGRDWTGRPDFPHIEWSSNTVPPTKIRREFDEMASKDEIRDAVRSVVREEVNEAKRELRRALVAESQRIYRKLAHGDEKTPADGTSNIQHVLDKIDTIHAEES